MSRYLRLSIYVLASMCASAFAVAFAAQAASPLAGTWKLNVEKSKYSPANLAPKSGTTKLEVTGDTIKATIDGVDSQGRKTHQDYTAKFDGKEVPCNCTVDGKPSPDQDAVMWKKLDNRTYELAYALKGKTMTMNHIMVAADGKSRTNTVTGKNAQGQTVNHTVLYEKQ
jgi:hypothetical protein